jgi:AcrR family transcriptional regulator
LPKVTGLYKTELKEKMIQAAIASFALTGFDRTKMEDIAKRLGISKGTIYLYFASKEELFLAICEYYHNILRDQLSTFFTKKEDLVSDIERFYDNFRKLESGNERVMLEAVVESVRNPKLKRMMYEHRMKVYDVIVDDLNRLIEKGFFRKELDVNGIASAFVALYDGLRVSKTLGVSDANNKKAWIAMVKATIEGIS